MAQALRVCEQITFNAEAAEAAEKKCLGISPRALRALRSNVAFFHRLFRQTSRRWVRDLPVKEPIVYTYRLRQAVQPTPKSGSFKSAEKVPDTRTVRLAQA